MLSWLLVLMEVYIVMVTYVVMETSVDVHISFLGNIDLLLFDI